MPRALLRGAGVVAVASGVLAFAGGAAAHPLGNFTINHYAGIRVEPDVIRLDVVIDEAEVPTFEERRRLDADGDGDLSTDEIESARRMECAMLERALELAVEGAPVDLRIDRATLSFPMGAGLPTMRLECAFVSGLELGSGPLAIRFVDGSFPSQPGWREIVVAGDRVTIAAVDGAFLERSVSERLTRYPDNRLTRPLDMESVTFTVAPGGPAATSGGSWGGGSPAAGGLPAIFDAADLSPLMLLVAFLSAAALGAGHALTPGHGKTVTAAWLVGTRGTPRHAVGLALSVTVAHTLGVLALAALVLFAAQSLPTRLVAEVLPLAAAVGIVAIGGWMVAGELARLRDDRLGRHDDRVPIGATVTWRGLFALGLVGGIVPSTSALLILLGAIAAGRPGLGLVLVLAFGLGMAAILGGVGLAVVASRRLLGHLTASAGLVAANRYVPLGAAVVVLVVGAVLVARALLSLS